MIAMKVSFRALKKCESKGQNEQRKRKTLFISVASTALFIYINKKGSCLVVAPNRNRSRIPNAETGARTPRGFCHSLREHQGMRIKRVLLQKYLLTFIDHTLWKSLPETPNTEDEQVVVFLDMSKIEVNARFLNAASGAKGSEGLRTEGWVVTVDLPNAWRQALGKHRMSSVVTFFLASHKRSRKLVLVFQLRKTFLWFFWCQDGCRLIWKKQTVWDVRVYHSMHINGNAMAMTR